MNHSEAAIALNIVKEELQYIYSEISASKAYAAKMWEAAKPNTYDGKQAFRQLNWERDRLRQLHGRRKALESLARHLKAHIKSTCFFDQLDRKYAQQQAELDAEEGIARWLNERGW